MSDKEYASLLLPNVEHEWEYYEKMYPNRNLNEGAMVTRYAPSPTGPIHIGNLFSALNDIWYANQSNGVAFLRIEDTDHKREIENGVDAIVDDLKNLDIFYDEGYSIGGKYG